MSQNEIDNVNTAERVLRLSLELVQAKKDRKEAAAMHKENIARIEAELNEQLKLAEAEEENQQEG